MRSLRAFWKWFRRIFRFWSRAVSEELKTPSPLAEPASRAAEPPKIPPRERIQRVQVGLDFGTSCTKIAYSLLGTPGRIIKPILFDHGLPHYPSFCLPSVVAVGENGELLFGEHAVAHLAHEPWDSGFRRMKVAVAGKYDPSFRDTHTELLYRDYATRCFRPLINCWPEHLCVAFLAEAMNRARKVIQKKYEGYDLDLAFNICVPIEHLENNDAAMVFDRIFAAAERLEKRWPIGPNAREILTVAKEQFVQTGSSDSSGDTRVFSIPEAVAQNASYLTSLQVRSGQHALIDIGAGTTDISIFTIAYTGRKRAPARFLAARNLPKGTSQIEKIVAAFLSEMVYESAPIRESQLIQVIEDLGNQPDELQKRVKQELRSIWEATHPVWGKAYEKLRQQSSWEKDNVQVFLSGGGSKLPYALTIFNDSWMRYPQDWGPYPLSPLPRPENYDDQDGAAPFDRMSVAYGLSIPKPELEGYRLPKEVGDMTASKPPKRTIPIDRQGDTLVPNRTWLGSRYKRR